MKRTIILILFLLLCFPVNVYADSDFKATWNDKNNTIELTWSPLPEPEEGFEYYLYHNYGDGWMKNSTGKIDNNETSRTISNYLQNTEIQYQIQLRKDGKKVDVYATSNKITTQKSSFTCIAKWTGDDIEIKWFHATKSIVNGVDVTIWTDAGGEDSHILFEHDGRESATIRISEYNFFPQEGDQWTFSIFDGGDFYGNRTIACGEVGAPGSEDSDNKDNKDNGGIPQSIPIFQANSWIIVMFWYKVLASLSGVFIFFTFIRCGYQYMHTENSGTKASVIDTLQKCVIALVFIMMAPTIIDLLIQINDAIVEICLNALNDLTTKSVVLDTDFTPENYTTETDWIGSLFAWPFKVILKAIEELFGLHSLGNIIFNNAPETTILSDKLFYGGALDRYNPFAHVLISLAFMAFTIYYNAVYLLRRWVIVAVTAITPIIVWVWTLSENKQVIQLWLAEVFQTIFMQTFHALTFGIFFSVLCFSGNIPTLVDTGNVAASLINVGKFVAWFGGIACAGCIIFNSFKMITATTDQAQEEARTNLTRAVIGLIVIGLSLLIAGVLTENQIAVPIPDESSGTSKITIFQLFMVMVAIIPVSKMLSTIFMNLISRIGTVDEDQWAGRSLGMIGGLFGLGMATGKAASGIPGTPNPKNLAGEKSDVKPPALQSVSAGNNPNYHADPYGIKDKLEYSPGIESTVGHQGSMLRPQDIGQEDGSWVYNHDTGKVQDYDNFVSGKEDYLEPPPMTLPEGIPVPSSVNKEWSDTLYNKDKDKFYNAETGEEVPGILPPAVQEWINGGCVDPEAKRKLEQIQKEKAFTNTIKDASESQVAKGFSKAGTKAGTIGSSVAPGTQGFFEGVAKTAGAMPATIAAMNAGTGLISSSGFRPKVDTSHIQEFTGRNTTTGGLAQMGAATILSPLGGNVAGKVSTKLGSGVDIVAPPFEGLAQKTTSNIKQEVDWVFHGGTSTNLGDRIDTIMPHLDNITGKVTTKVGSGIDKIMPPLENVAQNSENKAEWKFPEQ